MREIQELIENGELKSVFSVKLEEFMVILHKYEDEYFAEYDFWTESSYLEAKGKDEGVKVFIEQIDVMFQEMRNDLLDYEIYTYEEKEERLIEWAQNILESLEYIQHEHDEYAEYIAKHSSKLAYLLELTSDLDFA
ncbi:hypothetical protein [Brevibacillus agri]|uniref:hypothetical protein n=1 Tax=Brevibacillus agri TaxID=51101 RepID=UPI003D1D7B40